MKLRKSFKKDAFKMASDIKWEQHEPSGRVYILQPQNVNTFTFKSSLSSVIVSDA